MSDYFTIKWSEGIVQLLDQRLLPHQTVYVEYKDYRLLADAIKQMVIRGAPALGAAGGFGIALAAFYCRVKDKATLRIELEQAAQVLKNARPTARNLSYGIERVMIRFNEVQSLKYEDVIEAIIHEACLIAEEDGRINRQIGINALPLIPDPANIIHHCNTGTLATVDYGTALGAIRAAHENGKRVHVFVDETRPRLQGSRLTAWELQKLGISHTILVDNASGYIMRYIGVDLCMVGCDRIAANGDTANKIGTYNLALVASAHQVPFYVVGPISTIDQSLDTGDEIVIEQRPGDEITHIGEYEITPAGVDVINPAFDITPAKYITAIITELGIIYPPFRENIARLLNS